jgi:hypothetical protein
MNGADCPGCLILLVDESAAMESLCQDGQASVIGNQLKRKSEALAATLNSLIRQLTAGTNFDIALVGYYADSEGLASVRSCWDGELAGRDFVSLEELAAHPVRVEQRPRKLPDPTSIMGFREEMFDFPVWYTPQCMGSSPQIKAFQRCQELLTQWQSEQSGTSRTPLVLHLFAGGSSDGNPFKAIDTLQKSPSSPLVFQAHLCVSEHVPATLYAASRAFVPVGPARDLFDRCSPLPANLIAFLKGAKVAVGPNARGMAYNGRMTDIVQFLAIAKEHTRDWPAKSNPSVAAPEATVTEDSLAPSDAVTPLGFDAILPPFEIDDVPADNDLELNTPSDAQPEIPREKAACVLFILDRSVTDPFDGNTQGSWNRLQEHANSLLAKIAKVNDGELETGIISYGTDALGTVEVRQTFEGPLSGKTLVTRCELADGPIRIDEVEQQEPDGVGGLMTITLKKKVYVELEPTTATSPVSAFEAAQLILLDWCSRHPNACAAPIVMHLTRGQLSTDDLTQAWERLSSIHNASGSVIGYHLVATEEPHTSVVFPVEDSGLQTESLKALFEKSARLLGSESLEASKPRLVKADSRGFVVNGKFDFLMDGILEAFSKV